MPTYITLARWTTQGITNVKESPKRLAMVKQVMKDAGGKLKGFYMTLGQYDMVVISEAPDDETFAKIMLAINAGGSVTSETLKAFGEDDYKKIIAALP